MSQSPQQQHQPMQNEQHQMAMQQQQQMQQQSSRQQQQPQQQQQQQATPNHANVPPPSSNNQQQQGGGNGGGHHHNNNNQQQQQQQQQQQPLSANANHQETILQRVCEIFKESFGRDEAQCRKDNRKYLLTRVIGHGATGVVLNAKSIHTGQSFAVKIVEVANMSTSDKDRAMAEVHSLITCNFFSVLKCHDDFVQYAVTSPKTGGNNNGNTSADNSNGNMLKSSSAAPDGAATDANAAGASSSKDGGTTSLIVSSSANPHPHLTNNLLNKDPMMLALVVDLANAGDLRQEIKNRARRGKPFKEHEVGLLFIQILMAVHHVHCHHMIHRDIKTANVFLCSNGLVKLGDFGFSKQYKDTVSTEVGRTFCGTPYYVAPEIWRRKPYSKKADMFSLGVLLYETLALKRPFEGATMTEVMEKTLQGQYDPLPPNTSPEMQRIVKDLLSTNPAHRPSSGQLLQYPLSKLFMDALVSIVQSHGQTTFDESIRNEVNKNVAETRLTLKNPLSIAHAVSHANLLSSMADAMGSSRSVGAMSTSAGSGANQVIVNNMTLDNRHIYHEGMVHKLSGDGQWKRRYLCIFRTINPNYVPSNTSISAGGGGVDGGQQQQAAAAAAAAAADNGTTSNIGGPHLTSIAGIGGNGNKYEYKLLIAITKDTIRQQCIVAPCHEFEDVFPVPPRYAGSNAENVFSLVYRTGAKRLAFQAGSPQEQSLWMAKIQIALGLEEEEESSAVEIPL